MAGRLKSIDVVATATVATGPHELVGYSALGVAADGTIVLRDGGGSGVVKHTIRAPSTSTSDVMFPDGKTIKFETDVHATVTTCAAGLLFG